MQFYENNIFIKSLSNNIENINKFKLILEKLEKYNTSTIKKFNYEFIISEIQNIKNNTINYTDTIPIEFCDPILYIPIEEPCILPESDIIVDKKTILNHLVHSKSDPFNRTNLTEEILEQYNLLDSSKKIINDFKSRFCKWKQNNVKKSDA